MSAKQIRKNFDSGTDGTHFPMDYPDLKSESRTHCTRLSQAHIPDYPVELARQSEHQTISVRLLEAASEHTLFKGHPLPCVGNYC